MHKLKNMFHLGGKEDSLQNNDKDSASPAAHSQGEPQSFKPDMSSQKKHGLHSSSTPIQGHQPCSIPSNPAERSTPQSSKPDLPCDNAGQEQESSPKSIAIIATFQTLKDTDLSQRLWDEAFGNIIADENEKNLAENYLVALKNLLQKKKADDMKITRKSDIEAIDVSVQLRDPAKRQVYLHDLLKTGLDRVEKVSKFSEYLGNISEAVLATKPAVDLITSSVPQAAPAAVPWAGVCLGLQILTNPANAKRANLAGIDQVGNKMDWYCDLVSHLLAIKTPQMFESWKPTLRKIISNIITLYTKILTFQMKSVCMYYRNRGFTFIRELAYWDNWDALLGDVVSAENDLIDGWKQYNDAQALEFRQNLTILTEEANCRLENINQTLQSIFHRQEQWRRNDEDESCLNDLLIVRPQDYMALIHKDETLVASACNWILREQSFTALTNWADLTAPQCRVLWIHGRAGTGKTMLVINVIENLSNRSFIDAANLAFCFCQSQSKIKEPLNSATSAIRSLMWMLLIQQPHLIAHLRKDYKELKGKTFVDHTALVILVRVFESMLQDADTSPVYFLVDALDECDEDSGMLRDLISRSLSLNANVRWLISSRPETKLLVFLKKAHEKSPTILNTLFEIDIEAKQDRIENYIAEKKDLVRQSSQGNSYNDEILDTVSSMVKEKAEGNLLYMSFVFKRLLKVRGEKAEQEIRNYPTGLTRLYSHKLSQIKKVDNMDMKYCLGCLVAISLADRSLSLAELESINPSPTDMKYLVLSCESMLDIEDNMVSVVHNSAKDYLTANQSDLQDGAIQGHIDIVRNSLHAMSNLKRDIYELGSYGIISKDSKPPNPDPLAAIAYSCEFWSKHLCSAEKENPSRFEDLIQGIEITNFLENHFLHWLESLSLQKKLYVAFDSIQKIISVAQPQSKKNTRLVDFLIDAERFIRTHGSILEQAPLQLYGSALVFSPTNSKVRTLLWHQKWPFVGQVKGVLDNWSPILQTLESHKAAVNAIAFSPDGATLASASGDGEIRLWSVATGACKHVLDPFKDIDIPRGNGYTQTEFVVFSKDGLVASSHSLENKTRFWDAATGSLIYAVNQEKLPVGAVCSASFSVDGKTLGWTSREGKVKLWHAEAKGLQHLPECYGHRIVFSPNGKIFATRLDHKVLIWHITGKLKRTIIIEKTIDIYWLAFCPANNGDVLAVSTYGHGIYIWDVARKHLLQKINVPSASELAFSPDGKILAATAESDVWFLDIETGDHMQTIQGPQGFMLNGVAFSPDGKTLAMACSDGKVKLWDVTLVTKQKNVGDDRTQSTFGKVNSVAMSSNGKLAAMASSKAVRLLDLKNWSFTNFIGHDNTVIRVDFSEDEGTLVSESTDDTVRLWDMKGNTRHTVKNCHALAISQDRTTIATTLKDLTVDPGILKIATLDQWKLKGEPEPYLLPLAFSPDGTMLAAMSIEKIFVWDITKSDKLNEISHDGFYVEKPPLVFSPDNRTLAWGVGKSVKLWDWNDNKTREFDPSPVVENGVRNNNRMVQFVAFSPDGATIATTCFMDMMLRLWNSDGLQSKGTFNLNTQLGKLEFCDDASLLLTNRGLVDISGGKVNYDLDSDFPSLFVQDEWIVCGSQKLLWLPTEYRVANVGVSSLTVLLGHQNEGVTMIEFEAVIED